MSSNTSCSNTSNKIATCTWEIKKISQFNSGSRLSNNFPAVSSNVFYLKCYSKVAVQDFASYLMIYLRRIEPFNNDVQVQCRFAILNGAQEKSCVKVLNERLPVEGAVYVLDHAYILDPVNGLLQNDTLTVYCEIEILNDQSIHVKSKEPSNNDCNKITEDLSNLLESSKFSDVLFVIGTKEEKKKEFRLHKNILATRSEVFNAILSVDCEEKRKNRVEITDMTVPVFEEMIRYIYTGKTSECLELYPVELFLAAYKYQLDFLKNTAARELASKLSIESVSSVLLLADMCSAEKLKTNCIKYITENSKEVMQNETWKNLIETRIDLMVLLYRDISNSK